MGPQSAVPFGLLLSLGAAIVMLAALLITRGEAIARRLRIGLAGWAPVRAGLGRLRRAGDRMVAKPDATADLTIYLFGSLVLLVAGTGAAAVALQYGRNGVSVFDTPVGRYMEAAQTDMTGAVMGRLTSLGGLPIVPVVTVVAGLILVRRVRSFAPAVFLLGLVLVGQLVKWVLRELLSRAAPADPTRIEALASFPSGHVLAAVTLYGGIAFLIARRSESWAVKTWAWTAAILIVLGVSASRLYLLAHTASEVVGGLVIGSLLLLLGVLGLNGWEGLGRSEPLRRARNRVAGRALRWSLIVVSLGLIIQVVLLALPGIQESAGVLRDVRPALVILAVVLQVGANGALAEMYRRTTECFGGSLRYRQALGISMGTFTVSRIIPGGAATAGLFMAQALTRSGLPAAGAISSALVGGVVRMAVLGIIVFLGAFATMFKGDLPDAYLVGVPVFLVVIAAAGVVVVRMARSRAAVEAAFRSVERLVGVFGVRIDLSGPLGVVKEVVRTLPPVRKLLLPGSWAAANWLLDATSLWLLFRGFDYFVHPGVVLVGFGVANLINTVPITPGGVGLVEAGLAGAYVAFGVPTGVAVITVLAYRLISHWLPVAAGVPAYLRGVGSGPSGSLDSGSQVKA